MTDQSLPDSSVHALAPVYTALAAKSRGDVVTEAMEEAAHEAAAVVCAAQLVRAGGDVEDVVRMFQTRPYEIDISYTGGTDGELNVAVVWLDTEDES